MYLHLFQKDLNQSQVVLNRATKFNNKITLDIWYWRQLTLWDLQQERKQTEVYQEGGQGAFNRLLQNLFQSKQPL